MANLNGDNSFYYASTASEEVGSCPFLWYQMLPTTEEVYHHGPPTFSDSWTTVDQPGPSAIASTSRLATISFDSLPPALDSHPATSPGFCWSTIGQPTPLDHTAASSQHTLFLGGREGDTIMQAQTLNPAPIDFWAPQKYGVPTDTYWVDSTFSHHQPSVGMTRTGRFDRQFTPYCGTYSSRAGTYENTEAGQSTQAPPPTSYHMQPTARPAGGISETPANAEQHQSITEEEEAPVPQTQRPREGVARPHRERNHKDVLKLRKWAKALWGSEELPSHREAIAAAARIISVLRQPIYDEDRLFRGHGRRTTVKTKRAEEEYERRNGTRQTYQELSRHYLLGVGRSTWNATQLLVRVLEELDTLENHVGKTSSSSESDMGGFQV